MQSADSSPLHPSTNRIVYECLVTFIFLMFLSSLRQVVRRRQSSCGDILARLTTLTIIKDTTKLQVAWEVVLWNAASAAAPGWGKHKVEAGTALLSLASSRCPMGNWTKVKRAKSTMTFILCGVSNCLSLLLMSFLSNMIYRLKVSKSDASHKFFPRLFWRRSPHGSFHLAAGVPSALQ